MNSFVCCEEAGDLTCIEEASDDCEPFILDSDCEDDDIIVPEYEKEVEETSDMYVDPKPMPPEILEMPDAPKVYVAPSERCGPLFRRLPQSLRIRFIDVFHEYLLKTQPVVTEIVDLSNNSSFFKVDRRKYNVSFEKFLVEAYLPTHDFYDPDLEFLVLRFDREINFVESAKLEYECLIGCESIIVTDVMETDPYPEYRHSVLYL